MARPALIVFCLACLLLLAGTILDARADTGKRAFLLKQTCSMGPLDVYVTNDAALVECPSRGFRAVCKGPQYKVAMYRPGDRLFYQSSLDEWDRVPNVWYTTAHNRMNIAGREVPVTVSGVPCQEVTASGASEIKQFTMLSGRKEVLHISAYEYVYTDKLGVSRNICTFLRGMLNYPVIRSKDLHAACVPLSLRLSQTSGSSYALNTLSIKPVKYDAKLFDYPQQYKIARGQYDIIFGKDFRGDVTEYINGMNLGEEFGTKSKKP